ncbi:serine/threonine-protein kinase [Georgenia thermotolerans]|uniref:non-specific serine/threonine protein kinase n=1 Tax=Georgenia thermotolerans TaxID=527326 RepID=A0A7J5URJ3_9MICO|nr:serine/threonine-protein kinase [Georgenia thermotolerans]KAE8765008.1 protein kinase [Georgenia thermotolerans]
MAPPQPHLDPGTELAGYRIQSLIARGGMGVVYLATDVRLNRPVALKVLAPELSENEKFRSRFVRESQLAASVDHPNVIPVYGAGEWQGHLYIAMRYVQGTDLRAELALRGPLALPEALRILRDTAAALDAAHDAGLVHRDVKPGNILLADDRKDGHRHVYLTDFGLTKRSSSVTGMTTVGHFLGTLDYVAPEQIRGEDVDGRADVYALACVAFALLAGRPPFDHDDDSAQLWSHMYRDPPSLTAVRAEVPARVDAAIRAGMAKRREDRPSTCGALVALMETEQAARKPRKADRAIPAVAAGSKAGRPGRAAPAPAPDRVGGRPGRGARLRQRLRGPARRRPVLLAALGVAVVGLVAAGFVVAALTPEERTTATDEGLPYTLEVPQSWTVRTGGTGNTTVSVLSPTNLTALFLDEPAALEGAARTAKQDPASAVGLAVYHRPFLPAGASPAARVRGAEGLLPGTGAHLADLGTRTAGDAHAQAMHGTLPLDPTETLEVQVLVVETDPVQMLVFFAPTRLYDDRVELFTEVADSLRLKG